MFIYIKNSREGKMTLCPIEYIIIIYNYLPFRLSLFMGNSHFVHIFNTFLDESGSTYL